LQRVVDKAGQAVDVGRKLSKALDQMEHGLGGSALLRAVGNWIDMHVKQMALIRDINVSKLVKHVLTPEEGAEVKEIASKLRAEQWARREAEYALNLARVELASLAINNRGHVDDEKPISALAAENKALRAALRNARRQIDDMTEVIERRPWDPHTEATARAPGFELPVSLGTAWKVRDQIGVGSFRRKKHQPHV
jgi:hypothetical protein